MLSLRLFLESDQGLASDAIARAFGVPDDGAAGFEIGRAETGATLWIEQGSDAAWRAQIPTMRAHWSARDLLPACAAAASSLGGFFAPDGARPDHAPDLIAAWDERHAADVGGLVTTCVESGAPPPPFAARATLDDVHAALIALADDDDALAHPRVVHALDPGNGEATRFCVRLPTEHARFWVPALDGVLFDPEGAGSPVERPAFYPLPALGGAAHDGRVELARERVVAALRDHPGEPLERLRVITPVEVVDVESFPTL